MCGIFGLITNQNVNIGKVALDGISRLEYRGYDSCGIVSQSNGKLEIKKDSGKIREIQEKLHLEKLTGKIALAHTRWATHGPPNKINSHPHTDCTGDIAVIHNGIIENFMELKKDLVSKGHEFKSETDTEIIPHLIEDNIKAGMNFRDAVIQTLKRCRGAYGIATCYAKNPEYIIIGRKESPIIVGIEEGKTSYCASDIPALLPYTKNCYIMGDDELAILKPGEVEFYDISNSVKLIEKQPQLIKWDVDAAEKGGYEHFMLKEIFEEPKAMKKTLKIAPKNLKKFATLLNSAENVYITAAGTSFYASLAGKFIISRFLGKYIQAIECSEFQTQLNNSLEDDAVIIAVSQSGETVDTIEAIRWAKENHSNIKILSITNIVGSSITRYSDHTLITQAGPEIGVAATKTYCTQVLTLALIGLEIAKMRKQIPDQDIDKYYKALKETPNVIEEFLNKNVENIKRIVDNLEKNANYFFLARGISIATAKEGGLKLKEVACRFIEGYSAAHAKHGPISLVREGFPIIFIAPPDETYERLIGNVMEFKARGGQIISLVVSDDETIAELSDITIKIPQPATKYYNLFSPLTFIPALQLLAYYAAIKNGLDPDKPLNLAKTVTVH
ncbi:MAG: glutamine--fructose-6-phosphate transaminase (isomerizing) [Candidatus Lokiarchaeota archaeon]|nr:glutamine--fructose-6-phosphate transaminase (isomerizing) [Candidatus Lokiarchaeota archaeon]MBD3200245.1 glutamine--fructose-6-phosphate transaminase (isomerizing) [Candidatus Lokiarchaeota archaeon]